MKNNNPILYSCCSAERRELVLAHPFLNGIDFLEVVDNPADPPEERQTILLVHFLKVLTPGNILKNNILIEGGERITNIKVVDASIGISGSPPASPPMSPPTGDPEKILYVRVNKAGDFSNYTFRLVKAHGQNSPPDGIDPVLSSVTFSFKVSCPNEFDCQKKTVCDTEPKQTPNINYLAKDFASFRKLMLERLALLLPEWQENNPSDIGVTLVELLAYVGDHLSYHQDAIATEAYMGTARKRTSVRRHARLVDYHMHDGSNARIWVQIVVNPTIPSIDLQKGEGASKTRFVTTVPEMPAVINLNSEDFEELLQHDVRIFEPLHDTKLFSNHNTINFYTWGEKDCCLPRGATGATLQGKLENLKAGDVLILTEVKGPETGVRQDADPSHRHAVRITEIEFSSDPIGSTIMTSPPDSGSIPVTEVKWHKEDALPFPLCISSQNETDYFENVSVALGNIVLADHGLTLIDKEGAFALSPAIVPKANPLLSPQPDDTVHCKDPDIEWMPPRFRPVLNVEALTQAAIYKHQAPWPSAKSAMTWSMGEVQPEITLKQEDNNFTWKPVRDLLNSTRNSRHFVVEIENDGRANLRFGDNKHGTRPVTGTTFKAQYRVGSGTTGNIGAAKLGHIVSDDPVIYSNPGNIIKIWNPLPAKGGVEPESMEEVRQKAGYAFREQERAVTPDDYGPLAKQAHASVQRAAATYRWTGSWYTNFVTFDRLGGKPVDRSFENEMLSKLNRYRMAGEDLEIDSPRFVPLDIEMVVCLERGYYPSHVKTAILSVFNNGFMPDGNPGLFHPDRFTFGQTLYLSNYYAAAQAIPGVRTVQFTKFQRKEGNSKEVLESGKLTLNKLEIARLDNDPNFKEHGVFNIIIQ